MRNRLSIVCIIGTAVYMLAKSPVFATDPVTIGLSILLLLFCLGPAAYWVHSGMKTLPLFELYAACHLAYYWLPALKSDFIVWQMPTEFRVKLFTLICLYLGAGAVIYYAWLRRIKTHGSGQRPFWKREIDPNRARRLFSLGLGLWLFWQYALVAGILPNLGSALGVVRAAMTIIGSIAIFHFATRAGEGTLSMAQRTLFIIVLVLGVLLSWHSGFLVQGTVILCNAMFAYSLGGKRIPIAICFVVLLVLNFLNYGKAEFRQRFWSEEGQGTPAGVGIWNVYSYWIECSAQNFGQPKDEENDAGVLARANLLQMLGTVVSQSPEPLPYVNGRTYIQSVGLFVPSFLWKDRPNIHYPMQMLGIYYGIHTEESIEGTSISLGQIAEAYANFGWLGVIVVGMFFGFLFGIGVYLAFDKPLGSVGFLFGMLFVGWVINLEHSLGPWLMSFYQAAIVAAIGLYFISQPASLTGMKSSAASAPLGPKPWRRR